MTYNKTNRPALSVTIGNCLPKVGKTLPSAFGGGQYFHNFGNFQIMTDSHYLHRLNSIEKIRASDHRHHESWHLWYHHLWYHQNHLHRIQQQSVICSMCIWKTTSKKLNLHRITWNITSHDRYPLSGIHSPARVWKTSNGHNSATRHPIDFVFDSRLGFLARIALFNLTAHELHELYYDRPTS